MLIKLSRGTSVRRTLFYFYMFLFTTSGMFYSLIGLLLFDVCSAKVCDICRGLNITNPNMVLNMLYLGVDSCDNYYKAGMSGRIPDHLCDPLRYYAFHPCGCVNTSSKPLECVTNWSFGNTKYFDVDCDGKSDYKQSFNGVYD